MHFSHTDICSSTESSDSHKNEGFLKSVWHKLTDNPAHTEATKDTNSSETSSSEPKTPSPKDDTNSTKEDDKNEKKM
jgi:molecular chaperone DnaJ